MTTPTRAARTLTAASTTLAKRGAPVAEQPIRVLLAHDHAVVRAAIRLMLQRLAPDVDVIGEAASGREAVQMAALMSPNIILMDLDMPDGDGESAARAILAASPATRILILSMHTEDDRLLDVLRAGASGFLSRTADDLDLVDAIRIVAGGDVYIRPAITHLAHGSTRVVDKSGEYATKFGLLSDREQAVLKLVATGYNGPEIGRQLGINAKTVDTYKQRIEEKLGLAHRTTYVRFALQAGLLSA